MKTYDTAIVLGHTANNEILSARQVKRANKTIELYKNGLVKNIITTGGVGGLFNNTDIPLGVQVKKYIVASGIPENAVFDESKSTDTIENAKFSLEIMKEKGFKSAVVVTSFPHIVRSKVIFNEIFPKEMVLDYVVSDVWAGFFSTIWDALWEIGGWIKHTMYRALHL